MRLLKREVIFDTNLKKINIKNAKTTLKKTPRLLNSDCSNKNYDDANIRKKFTCCSKNETT